jgi:hypothetical protein
MAAPPLHGHYNGMGRAICPPVGQGCYGVRDLGVPGRPTLSFGGVGTGEVRKDRGPTRQHAACCPPPDGDSHELIFPNCEMKKANERGHPPQRPKERTTLSGGSLGSCVDEERSQLR